MRTRERKWERVRTRMIERMRMRMRMRIRGIELEKRYIPAAMAFPICMIICMLVQAPMSARASGGTIRDSPYVTLTEDKKAWTTNAGDRNVQWYEKGYRVYTGIASSLRQLRQGEHYYSAGRQGSIPVGYWRVQWREGQCIHNGYPSNVDAYHGISFGRQYCQRPHFSGWQAYCADCGERMDDTFVYMSSEAASSISYLEMGDMSYYYLCPFCNNLEQGRTMSRHLCRFISFNRYRVRYHANAPGQHEGYMADSIHMYDNAAEYNGKPVTAMTHLSVNRYVCKGYAFSGWNTEPDGSGRAFEDGQEILNLTDQDYDANENLGTVHLYAQWRPAESTLEIDPGAGSYGGKPGITGYTQGYQTSCPVKASLIEPPAGHTVSFETNGGRPVPAVTGTTHFTEWSLSQPFLGRLSDEIYYFTVSESHTDRVSACYESDSIALPDAQKEGSSFGGWYYDEELTEPAGMPGDSVTPGKDMTLYAQWVELALYSEANYNVNGGKGAVDLSWTQPDGKNKVYKLYQSRDAHSWIQVHSASDMGNDLSVKLTGGYTQKEEKLTIEYAGLYRITAAGAQGESCSGFLGGKGGAAEAVFWLKKGEVLTCTVGGQSGYNHGGSGTDYGNGGGCTVVSSDQKGVLVVAGGGGGATALGNGGEGGSEKGLLTSGYTGETGGAGGGGGYLGGRAGESIVHTHTEACYADASYNALETTAPVKTWSGHEERGDHWEEDGKCDDCFQYGKVMVGDSSHLIAVDGNTEVDIQAILGKCLKHGRGDVWRTSDSYVRLYNQDGACIYEQTMEGIPTEKEIMDYLRQQDAAWHQDRRILSFAPAQTPVNFYGMFAHTESDGNGGEVRNGGYDALWSSYNADGTFRVYGVDRAEEAYPEEYRWDTDGNSPVRPYLDDGFIFDEEGVFPCTGGEYPITGKPLVYSSEYTGYGPPETAVLVNEKISLPEGTTGIYLEVYAKGTTALDQDVIFVNVPMLYLHGGRKLICGMTEGQVVAYEPSYGGSSYVNTEYAYDYKKTPGTQAGDGSFRLDSQSVGYLDTMHLDGVAAPDMASPDAVPEKTVTIKSWGGERVRVQWQEPGDQGTVYYHIAESYLMGKTLPLCRSNMTVDTLTSGVKGYYYSLNGQSKAQVTGEDSYTAERELTLPVSAQTMWLHLAAVDVAGNIGETIHIPVDRDSAVRPLHTETLLIREGGDNVYPAGAGAWFVRSDGTTPFGLGYEAYMDGTATEKYQINYAVFYSVPVSFEGERAENRIFVPNHVISAEEFTVFPETLEIYAQGGPLFEYYPVTEVRRSQGNSRLSVEQQFTLSRAASGKELRIYPRAGAEYNETTVYSAEDEDMSHGITVIGDGEPPVIKGMELLESLELIDRRDGELVLNLWAQDMLSGVKEFTLKVVNTDNYCEKLFTADENGCIQVSLTAKEPVFSGDFTATAYASDNVGNETSLVYGTTEFGLTAQIERILEPHDPIFKNGESGILSVTVWGYPDYVEIEFPEEMTDQNPELNRTIYYTNNPRYCQEEQLQFMIPLYTPANMEYAVTVRAYKGDRRLEQHPELALVEVGGTVLDDFRTRLR